MAKQGVYPVDKYAMLTVDVPYAPGTLEAVASTGGEEVARYKVETTGLPTALKLIPDRPAMAGGGNDAQPVTVEAVDDHARVVPGAKPAVTFAVACNVRIIGLNNGDPTCHEPEQSAAHSLFHGLGQVIVQSGEHGSGPMTLRATADGLAPAEVAIDVQAAASPPAVAPAGPASVLSQWEMSPVTSVRPDPNQRVADTDMNIWTAVRPGRLVQFTDGSFAVVRTTFHPRAGVVKAGGTLTLRGLTGRAELYPNGTRAATKSDDGRATLTVPIPAGAADVTVSVLIETRPGDNAGLGGTVGVQ